MKTLQNKALFALLVSAVAFSTVKPMTTEVKAKLVELATTTEVNANADATAEETGNWAKLGGLVQTVGNGVTKPFVAGDGLVNTAAKKTGAKLVEVVGEGGKVESAVNFVGDHSTIAKTGLYVGAAVATGYGLYKLYNWCRGNNNAEGKKNLNGEPKQQNAATSSEQQQTLLAELETYKSTYNNPQTKTHMLQLGQQRSLDTKAAQLACQLNRYATQAIGSDIAKIPATMKQYEAAIMAMSQPGYYTAAKGKADKVVEAIRGFKKDFNVPGADRVKGFFGAIKNGAVAAKDKTVNGVNLAREHKGKVFAGLAGLASTALVSYLLYNYGSDLGVVKTGLDYGSKAVSIMTFGLFCKAQAEEAMAKDNEEETAKQ